MTTKSGNPTVGEKHSQTPAASGPDSNRAIGLYLAGCLVLAIIAAALLMSSCGGSRTESTAVAGEPATPVSNEVVPALAVTPPAPSLPASTGSSANSTESKGLPPEIALGELPSVVAPGEAIEISVFGTPDVTEMSLWDGLNDRQAFVHDSGTDVWKVDYRVPLRPKSERIGLSVTARNDLGRWRRVWAFVQVASTAEVTREVPIDSSVVQK